MDDARPCYSQPAPAAISFTVSIPPNETEIHSFSQPTQVEDLLLSSQLLTSQPATTLSNVMQSIQNLLFDVLLKMFFLELYTEISQENDKIYYLFIT